MNVINAKIGTWNNGSKAAQAAESLTSYQSIAAALCQSTGLSAASSKAGASAWQGIASLAILSQNASNERIDRMESFGAAMEEVKQALHSSALAEFVAQGNLAAHVDAKAKTDKTNGQTSLQRIMHLSQSKAKNYASRVIKAWDLGIDVIGTEIAGQAETMPESLGSLEKRIKGASKAPDTADSKAANVAELFRGDVTSAFQGCTEDDAATLQAYLKASALFLASFRAGSVSRDSLEAATLELMLATESNTIDSDDGLPGEDEGTDERGLKEAVNG